MRHKFLSVLCIIFALKLSIISLALRMHLPLFTVNGFQDGTQDKYVVVHLIAILRDKLQIYSS